MLVNFVIALTILLGCCGLALDIGLLQLKRLQLQNAADAAAMGALFAAERGATSANWQSAGIADAKLNGVVNGASGIAITITNPPASTSLYANNYGAFQATITQPVSAVFMGKSITIKAQATALMPPCGYFSAHTSAYSIFLQSAGLYGSCPLYASPNIYVDGFAHVGWYSTYVTGSSSASATYSNVVNPTYSYPAMADPLSYIASPSFSLPCNFLNISLGVLNTRTVLSTPLNPGVYCGGLTLLWTTATFNPGLYVIAGGLNVVSSTLNLNVASAGVTLYMTTATPGCLLASCYGTIYINGNTNPLLGGPSIINLSAPADSSNGGIPGILIFGDRNWVRTTQFDISLNNCQFNGDGIIYFPATGIYQYQCNILPPNYGGMVVDSIGEFVGINDHLIGNFSFVQGGNPFRPKESLAE